MLIMFFHRPPLLPPKPKGRRPTSILKDGDVKLFGGSIIEYVEVCISLKCLMYVEISISQFL